MKTMKLAFLFSLFLSLNLQAGVLADYNNGDITIEQVVQTVMESEDISQSVEALVLEEKELAESNTTIKNKEALSIALSNAFREENDSRQTANWGKRIAGVVVGAVTGFAATIAHIKIVDQTARGYQGTGKGLMIAYMLAGGALGYAVGELTTEDYLSSDFEDEINL
jgi:hypothetical protein